MTSAPLRSFGASVIAPRGLADVELTREREADRPAVEALIADAFGPGRFAKTAERVREHARLRPELSFCAWLGGEFAGAVRLWSVRIGETSALFLGPIAVAAHLRGRGIAAQLVDRVCEAGAAEGERVVLLVGDLERFGPMGFAPVEPGRVDLGGPVDPHRLLWRALTPEGLDGVAGRVGAPA